MAVEVPMAATRPDEQSDAHPPAVDVDLAAIARALVAEGKGILAADESSGTIAKRFAGIHLESNGESRRSYRELLFTAPGIEAYLSGAILFEETLRQGSSDGTPLGQVLSARGIIPGVKVDAGTVDLPGFPGEKVTEGLDGLRGRLDGYRVAGARFAKWRAVLGIAAGSGGDSGREGGRPSGGCILANAQALARYAATCQAAGLVPIVEPEVLMDGAHDIQVHEDATARTLAEVFHQLRVARVSLEGMLLKANMVLSGDQCPRQAGVDEVAEATLRCMRRHVPAAVPGIVFLSGGQSPRLATAHLAAINAHGRQPWELSFSYGRALQEPVLETWRGERANAGEAQRRLLQRARLNGAARSGAYSPAMETPPSPAPG